MKSDSFEPAVDTAAHLFDSWFDPIESGVRERVREFIEELIQCELDATLSRPRYGRAKNANGGRQPYCHRHGGLSVFLCLRRLSVMRLGSAR